MGYVQTTGQTYPKLFCLPICCRLVVISIHLICFFVMLNIAVQNYPIGGWAKGKGEATDEAYTRSKERPSIAKTISDSTLLVRCATSRNFAFKF